MNQHITSDQALVALRAYKEHRPKYDRHDWEIERIYRRIAKGETVISVQAAIHGAGLDEQGRPRLAICQAHAEWCRCTIRTDRVTFGIRPQRFGEGQGRIVIPWENHSRIIYSVDAKLPRIPPQHRPKNPWYYHMLWEADWEDLPVDPILIRRIGRDAWVVLAAWDLTEVELSVLRSHRA